MGFFSSLFHSSSKRDAGTTFPELRCRDLSQKQSPSTVFWRQAQKGKTIHKVPTLPFSAVVEHFAPEIKAYVEVLPLEEEVIDSVIMPVIRNVILHVHLLPASEAHHHCGVGGLLIHSLQTARSVVQLAEQIAPSQDLTPQMRYRLRHLVPVVASLGMLLHDCGKTQDMVVVAEDGQEWMPDAKPLTLWLEGHEHYFVYWKPEREHKRHELASLRFAYSRLLTKSAFDYLVENRGMGLFDSVAEAMLLGSGSFASLCKAAEERSIEAEKFEKRSACVAGVQVSVPLVAVILRAMKTLISEGTWLMNAQDSQVFATTEGFFLAVNEKMGGQVRSAAVRSEGAEQVPSTTESILQVLEDAGLIAVGAEGPGKEFWQLKPLGEEARAFPCVKFLGGIHDLVPDGSTPKLLEARIEKNAVTLIKAETSQPPTVACPKPTTTEVRLQETNQDKSQPLPNKGIDLAALRAPKGRFLEEKPETPKPTSQPEETKQIQEPAQEPVQEQILLRPDELHNKADVKLNDRTCKEFCFRLVKTAEHQLLQGKGELVVDGVSESEQRLSASSAPFEKVLERYGMDVFAFQTICRMFKQDTGFVLDEKARVIRIAKPNREAETTRSNSG